MAKPTDEGVLIHERTTNALISGTVVWEAGTALSKFFAWGQAVGSPMSGRSVLELGAGTGSVGLTLAKLGARVTLTDKEPRAVELLEKNIAANKFDEVATLKALDWADRATYLAPTFDFIVATDVLYAFTAEVFLQALEAHMSSHAVAFLAYSHFLHAIPETLMFFPSVLKRGLHIEQLEDAEGQVAGCVLGQPPSVFDGSRFVALDAAQIVAQVRDAKFTIHNEEQVHIFRLTWASASPGALAPSAGASEQGLRARL